MACSGAPTAEGLKLWFDARPRRQRLWRKYLTKEFFVMSDLRGVYEVVGFRFVEYTSQSDGQKRSGYDVCLRRCEDLPGQVGVPDESVWLGSRAAFKPELGVMVRKSYNRWGKVEDLIPV